MNGSTVDRLLATFQAIAEITEDKVIARLCLHAIDQAEAEKFCTAELPEPLLISIHLYMLAAHALAHAASEQPGGIKGLPVKAILATAIQGALDSFEALTQERKHEVLIISARKLGEMSGAASVDHRYESF